MNNKLFISHSTYDKDAVAILARLIKRISLNQIQIWFSNDTNTEGGFIAGANWFDDIINNLKSSKAVLSFITPNSNGKDWILYESGYAEALESTVLIPLKFLISVNEISIPLQHKQIFGFSNLEEANITLRKLLNVFGIVFDEEVFKQVVKESLNEMRNAYKNKSDCNISAPDILQELSKKVDDYMGYIINLDLGKRNSLKKPEYEVGIQFENRNNKTIVEYIRLHSLNTVSDALDRIYCLLDDKVKPFNYLLTWILREKKSERYLVISDIQDWVPATAIFKPRSEWEVVFLDKPYEPTNFINKSAWLLNNSK